MSSRKNKIDAKKGERKQSKDKYKYRSRAAPANRRVLQKTLQRRDGLFHDKEEVWHEPKIKDRDRAGQ